MIPLTISEIIEAIKGRPLTGVVPNGRVKNISTDTRTLKRGDLFFAIPGPNFDGYNFLREALQKGAGGLVVSRPVSPGGEVRVPIIYVKDTRRALGDLARYYRRKIRARVIAITGSNGKTTTKEMVYHILRHLYSARAVLRAPRSFNNSIGVPLTMLSVEARHRYVIFEVGTNRPGEIWYLGRIIRPEVAVITNIAPTHLEGLKSMRGVVREKVSLFKTISPGGFAVFEAGLSRLWQGNKWLKDIIKSAEYKRVTFGMGHPADIRGDQLEITPAGLKCRVNNYLRLRLSIPGSWNMTNALAALAVIKALGINLRRASRALGDFKLPEMRMQKEMLGKVTFINDAYNANPESVSRVLEDLGRMRPAGRKILVLGEMRELGKYCQYFHRQIADKIYQAGVATLFGVGEAVRDTIQLLNQKHPEITTFYFGSTTETGDFLASFVRTGDLVLLKGSRAIGLEEVLSRVKQLNNGIKRD